MLVGARRLDRSCGIGTARSSVCVSLSFATFARVISQCQNEVGEYIGISMFRDLIRSVGIAVVSFLSKVLQTL